MRRKFFSKLSSISFLALLVIFSSLSVPSAPLAEDVSEEVAYEAFLVIAGQPNAAEWLRNGDFDRAEIDNLALQGKSWLGTIDLYEKVRLEARSDRSLSNDDIEIKIARFSENRSKDLNRVIQKFLPQTMGSKKERIDLLRAFVNSKVRANIRSYSNLGRAVYAYSAMWDHDSEVYGVTGLITSYSDQTTYSISNKLTAPTNNYSSVTRQFLVTPPAALNKLKIHEDGLFRLQSELSASDGKMTWTIGELSMAYDVKPQLYIADVKLSQPQVAQGQTLKVEVKIRSTQGIPVNTPISIELFEWATFGARSEYRVVGGRTRDITIATPGVDQVVVFPLEFNTITETAEMKKRVRIFKAPETLKVAPDTMDMTFKVVSQKD